MYFILLYNRYIFLTLYYLEKPMSVLNNSYRLYPGMFNIFKEKFHIIFKNRWPVPCKSCQAFIKFLLSVHPSDQLVTCVYHFLSPMRFVCSIFLENIGRIFVRLLCPARYHLINCCQGAWVVGLAFLILHNCRNFSSASEEYLL